MTGARDVKSREDSEQSFIDRDLLMKTGFID
jgi:hypothetical protein